MAKETRPEAAASEAELQIFHGDVLDSIFTRVPLIDLVSASHVSRSWKCAVSSSLRHFNRPKPWLLLHTQSTRSPYRTATHAYDPRSHVWIEIKHPSAVNSAVLRSSHTSLLYMLSPSKFSLSFDSLHLTWHHIDAPQVWRIDPIVAVVGHRVVVAGGGCDFEDDPRAVEVYNMNTREWETCEASMPAVINDCAASSFSIAASSDKLHVVEKSSSVALSFDPCTKSWHGPCNLRPAGSNICCCAIGFSDERLILIGATSTTGEDEERLESVKLWQVNVETMEIGREIAKMPSEYVEKLNGEEVYSTPLITACFQGAFVYLSNNSAPEEVVICELNGDGGGACRWSSVRNVIVDDICRLTRRLIFTCSKVDMRVLQRAMGTGGRIFAVKSD